MSEKPNSPEFSESERELIEHLHAHGSEDTETRRLLLAWTEKQETEANAINTPRANIEVNLRRARLYHAAGFSGEAWEVLESVRRQATQEGETDLYEQAISIMDEIDSESG